MRSRRLREWWNRFAFHPTWLASAGTEFFDYLIRQGAQRTRRGGIDGGPGSRDGSATGARTGCR
jgi:hypothetical protein